VTSEDVDEQLDIIFRDIWRSAQDYLRDELSPFIAQAMRDSDRMTNIGIAVAVGMAFEAAMFAVFREAPGDLEARVRQAIIQEGDQIRDAVLAHMRGRMQ